MMNRLSIFQLLIILILAGLAACKSTQPVSETDPITSQIPPAEREFRAAWVATVANINWPSAPGLPVDSQQVEAIRLLDLLQDHHFNAVIFQVRPQCDALYQSPLEPWSYFLTGRQGQAPEPFYDPLYFWIEEAHRRGLELHVWLNPYRAHHTRGGEITDFSVIRKKPKLAVQLANGYWWLDPGKPGTVEHSYQVAMDLVNRYDIDGLHFDDYFYPYPSYNGGADFPDDESWQVYKSNGGSLSRHDWRRENVNQFVQKVYQGIKAAKPHVKFGISPFGIWRPGNPSSIKGFDQYEQLYADARLWLQRGWVDYFTPQLYWPTNQIPQSFPVLLGWWKEENILSRHLWPGMSIGRFQGEKAIDETINQIMISRGMLPRDQGHVHWSIGPLVQNDSLKRSLKAGPYLRKALVPSSPWLSQSTPAPPEIVINRQDSTLFISWAHSNPADIAQVLVYYKYDRDWQYQIFPSTQRAAQIPFYQKQPSLTNVPRQISVQEVAVSAVNRFGNESKKVLKKNF